MRPRRRRRRPAPTQVIRSTVTTIATSCAACFAGDEILKTTTDGRDSNGWDGTYTQVLDATDDVCCCPVLDGMAASRTLLLLLLLLLLGGERAAWWRLARAKTSDRARTKRPRHKRESKMGEGKSGCAAAAFYTET